MAGPVAVVPVRGGLPVRASVCAGAAVVARMGVAVRGRRKLLAGPTPCKSLNAGSRFLQGCDMALRARGPDFRLPTAPADGHDRYRRFIVGGWDARRGGR